MLKITLQVLMVFDYITLIFYCDAINCILNQAVVRVANGRELNYEGCAQSLADVA
jgi:hypothetical protein